MLYRRGFREYRTYRGGVRLIVILLVYRRAEGRQAARPRERNSSSRTIVCRPASALGLHGQRRGEPSLQPDDDFAKRMPVSM